MLQVLLEIQVLVVQLDLLDKLEIRELLEIRVLVGRLELPVILVLLELLEQLV